MITPGRDHLCGPGAVAVVDEVRRAATCCPWTWYSTLGVSTHPATVTVTDSPGATVEGEAVNVGEAAAPARGNKAAADHDAGKQGTPSPHVASVRGPSNTTRRHQPFRLEARDDQQDRQVTATQATTPAMRLIPAATITTPNTYAKRA